jgi:hypothetical protein
MHKSNQNKGTSLKESQIILFLSDAFFMKGGNLLHVLIPILVIPL